ncbi:transcription antiterminator BglG [Paenibacillus yonginensis]|uniref:Transcription antiterminator BglG n=2 Tax=Paenibacillus TaxID=44249 RepID=A0A1B1MY70_9BACL|nr:MULTISPECIES: PRD domain-containing protein [Paenibacillus]ANS74121.1 transcription antiterminator BglG [Paenibacillus yonginensis]GGA38729.1 PtsGHI operon antiterminator [Paenibacillus physcomitrellae]
MKEAEILQVQRIIGNNVVMANTVNTNKEYVLLGKGIGFIVKNEGTIDVNDPRIEKRFRLEDREQWSQYQSILEDFDPKVIEITDKIIEHISREFPGKLNDKVYLALPSHLQFTIYRIRHGMDIINPFLLETKLSFPKEYEIASKIADMIGQEFELEIPEDEIGFLTYHVYSAASDVPVGQLVKASNIVGRLIEAIQQEKNIHFDQGSLSHVRLMLHLRYSIERILQGTSVDNPFVNHIRFEYREEYALAQKLGRIMAEELDKKVPEEEICYMAMHLYRLFQRIRR